MSRAFDYAVVVATVLMLAVGPIAFAATPTPVESTATAAPALSSVSMSTGGLRSLPLVATNGFIAKAFPDGQWLDELSISAFARGRVRQVLDTELMKLFGRRASSRFWAALAATDPVPQPAEGAAPYPPSFGAVDDYWSARLTRGLVKAHKGDLIELSSLLVLAAAGNDDDLELGGAAAFSLLRTMGSLLRDCDTQLSLAFTASLGLVSDGNDETLTALDHEFTKAARLCRGDITVPIQRGQLYLAAHLWDRGLGPVTKAVGASGR